MSSGDPSPQTDATHDGPIDRVLRVWRDEYETIRHWPLGRRHLIRRAAAITLVDTLALMAVSWLLPSVVIDGFIHALAVTLLSGTLTFLVRPIAFLVLRQGIVTTAALTVLFMGLTLWVAELLVPGVRMGGPLWAFLTAILIAGVNTVVIGILGLDEDESFYRNTLKKLARARGDVDDRPGPGFVILQVDGLAEPVIRHALRTGYMPFLSEWIRSGSHVLGRWEALAPSMTSAGQTGILHGNNAGIPAFRWWEKDRGVLMVSNKPQDALLIEQRASGPNDLLADGGASIANLVSGGAPRAIATNSQLAPGGRGLHVEGFSLYLVNPYNVTRGLIQFTWTIILELFQARTQRQRGVVPRIGRGMPFPFLRASTTTIMRDMLTDLVIGEMYRGTPVIYADYLGYDEVAHHAGPERPEAMDELIKVDRQVRTIARAVAGAPRDYRIVLLSDHGQSQGAPFEQRFGKSLEELVRELCSEEAALLAATENVEAWGPLNAFATEALRGSGRASRVARRALRGNTEEGGVVDLGTPGAMEGRTLPGTEGAGEGPDVIVAASGNLANVYFPQIEGRATLEEIVALHPGLVRGLATHPGIGFVLVRSAARGPVAIGARGLHLLADGEVIGEDPLAVFGPHTADNLRRLDGFTHTGDLLINSAFDPSTEEIVPFEDQVGAHGGLGGAQTRAFVLYPAELESAPEPVSVVGAEAVNALLHRWIARAREIDAAGGAAPAEAAPVHAEVDAFLRERAGIA